MSGNNSKGSKTHKGQQLILPGSFTGEPIVSNRYAYNSASLLEFCGEAKFGTPENTPKWFIQKFEYDLGCDLAAVLNACNQVTTKATDISVDTTSNSPDVKITIVGGVFDQIGDGDKITIDTAANKWVGKFVSKLSATEITVSTEAVAVDETTTAIADEDFLITLENDKEFHRRRWDKREFYIYA